MFLSLKREGKETRGKRRKWKGRFIHPNQPIFWRITFKRQKGRVILPNPSLSFR